MSIAVMNYPDNRQFGGERVSLLLAHNSRLPFIIAQNQGGRDFKQLVPSLQSTGKEADTCMSICWLDLYSSRMIFFTHIIQDSLPREL